MIKKIYIIAIIILPILFQYSIGIATLTLGDAILMLMLVFLLFSANRGKIIINKPMVALLIFLLATIGIFIAFKKEYTLSTILTTVRYCFYILNVIFFPMLTDEYGYAVKVYNNIALIASAFLILQVICIHVFDIYLPGVISLFKLTDQSLYIYDRVIHYAQVKRCMSFFGEPTHFATYVIGYMVVLLFGNKRVDKKKIGIGIFISLAVVLSTSITGMLVLAIIWVIWFIKYFFHGSRLNTKFFAFAFLAITFLFIASRTDAFSYLMTKSVITSQSSMRFGGILYIINNFGNNFGELLLGNGMNDIAQIIYLSGYPRMIHYYGLIGSMVYLAAFASMIKRKRWSSNMLLFTIAVLSLGTEMTFGCLVLPYLLFIVSRPTGAYLEDVFAVKPVPWERKSSK